MIIVNLNDPDQKPLFRQFLEIIKSAPHQAFIEGVITERRVICLSNGVPRVRWYGPEPVDPELHPERLWISIVSDDIHDAQVSVALSEEDMMELKAVLAERWSSFKQEQQKLAAEEQKTLWEERRERDHQLLDRLRKDYSEQMAKQEESKGPKNTSSGSLAY